MKHLLKTACAFAVISAAVVFAAELRPADSGSSEVTSSAESVPVPTAADSEKIYRCLGSSDFYVLREETGEIVKMSEEEYVIGAVMAEMPADYPEEALKAQAAAAHTYAVRRREEQLSSPDPKLCGAYISDDPQKYQGCLSEEDARKLYGSGYDDAYRKISEAVKAVSDKVMICGGEPIVAAFHAISPGRTESAENVWGSSVSYLMPVESPFDETAADFSESFTFTAAEVRGRLTAEYPDKNIPEDILSAISVTDISPSGTVLTVSAGELCISGSDMRRIFSLPSAAFELSSDGEALTVVTKGSGHGVGMSQYGAKCLAEQGFTYEEIIKYYYTGAELARLEYSE
ncbi:MAG: stage II sporulation protein D [Oscillospiraceae bacterium]|nr:stage II sporulation protein D [Oscillospiraceae bacterium]